jgi:hypothetical protein
MGTDQISRQFGHKETNILRYSDAIARVSEIAALQPEDLQYWAVKTD